MKKVKRIICKRPKERPSYFINMKLYYMMTAELKYTLKNRVKDPLVLVMSQEDITRLTSLEWWEQ